MNIVFVKHGCSKEYCFSVPDELVPYVKKNMTVLVKTQRGLDTGTTTTDVISGDGAVDVATRNGAYFPLKPVISFINEKLFETIRNEIANRLKGMDFYYNELPF
jgi:hypothetical protein